ncbi:MAG: hypothetical protein IKY04_05935 [Lachnospiraceae bacterium]|nr:hypothetical protein [Lachnospiraceae bacterium]MBR4993773.1 hypothetical protein [Lachnospiraceae bacterium]MBR5944633.1 hypothetical protein [Lachnospiraceae bacterium]
MEQQFQITEPETPLEATPYVLSEATDEDGATIAEVASAKADSIGSKSNATIMIYATAVVLAAAVVIALVLRRIKLERKSAREPGLK